METGEGKTVQGGGHRGRREEATEEGGRRCREEDTEEGRGCRGRPL
jgi:hypothetical protein